MDNESPLRRLILEEDAFAEGEIAVALERYVGFTSDGQVVLHPAFESLKTREQVLCLLLGLRAAQLLGLRETANASPQEIVEASGMAGGTVRPKLSALVKERLVSKLNGRYEVPIHALARATDALKRNRE